jgi:hypothetical protein
MRNWLNLWRKRYKKLKENHTKKSLLAEIDRLEANVASRDQQIEILNSQLDNKKEEIEKLEVDVRVKQFEVENLTMVIVRDRKRVEAEAQQAQFRIDRDSK